MLHLPKVTLLCVESRSPEMAVWAIEKCTQQIKFARVVLVTDLAKVREVPENMELVQTPVIQSTEDFSDYLLSDLTPLIFGTHVLIMQWDSFVLDAKMWNDVFLEYDYIGAPWPHHPLTPVGNGGFSLRSTKLIKALQDPKIVKHHAEDQCICITNKAVLENDFKIQFAPLSVARQFAFEREYVPNTFGFHGFFNFAKVLTHEELQFVIDVIPKDFLGGVDTYDLIDELRANKYPELVNFLIKKTSPKKKLRKRYFINYLKDLFTFISK